MTKKIIPLLLFTLFFTACVERGYTPKPINNTLSQPIVLKNVQASISPKTTPIISSTPIVEKAEKNIVITKKEIVKKQVVPAEKTKVNVKEDTIFTLTEETKNKISGFFILIIGIIILL